MVIQGGCCHVYPESCLVIGARDGRSLNERQERTMRGLYLVLVAAMGGGVAPGMMFGQTAATAPAASKAMKAKAPATMPTDAEIADAKAKGMVWANENTKVYHKDDAQYGKTKHGKFMTEADAQAAGYRLGEGSPPREKKG